MVPLTVPLDDLEFLPLRSVTGFRVSGLVFLELLTTMDGKLALVLTHTKINGFSAQMLQVQHIVRAYISPTVAPDRQPQPPTQLIQ